LNFSVPLFPSEIGTQIAAENMHTRRKAVKASRLLLAVVLVIFSVSALAQTASVQAKPLTDNDIKLLREDVQSVKDDVIRHTMQLTEAEDAKFWPVYRDYAKEQRTIADKRLALITDYAQNLDKMDDAKASNMTQRLFQIDDDLQALRKQYFSKFEKALGAKRAAKFYQVDNRLTMLVNLQLASEIPLIP
jgi:Spy/CpxP family protein refolding chaperone